MRPFLQLAGPWGVILLLACAGAAQAQQPLPLAPGMATLQAEFEPNHLTVSVDEPQSAELRVAATLQCLPGLGAPRDVSGAVNQHGYGQVSPVYWNITPTTVRIPWQEDDAAAWRIDARIPFIVEADTPAPAHLAGLKQVVVTLAGIGLGPQETCTPAGYAWDEETAELFIQVPTAPDEAEPPEMTPAPGIVLLLLALGALVARRRRRESRPR